MLVRHVALVSEIAAVNPSQLTRVAAALQKQVARDFGPIWGVQATVNAFTRLEDVSLGYWPIIVEQDIKTPGGPVSTKTGPPSPSHWSNTTRVGR